jgi:hypothetical protein
MGRPSHELAAGRAAHRPDQDAAHLCLRLVLPLAVFERPENLIARRGHREQAARAVGGAFSNTLQRCGALFCVNRFLWLAPPFDSGWIHMRI